jgi:hypothetical protein
MASCSFAMQLPACPDQFARNATIIFGTERCGLMIAAQFD